jgi:decaprenylphospho-beta-D-ribofuranose 2-oxidase
MTQAPINGNGRLATDLEYVEGWGMAVGANSRVLRPTSVDEIRAAYVDARARGACVGLRGSGCSYGDASVNAEGLVLDVTRMNRVLDWDPETGVADLEGGVTIEQLWKHILPDGWWPKVVSGTMYPTIAGAAAMNIHGKNNYAVGTLGEAVVDFDIVLPDGTLRTCSRDENADLFHAAIGGFGMLGTFSRVKIGNKKVHSGELEVRGVSTRSLREMMVYFEEAKEKADYLVGWIDCFAGGDGLGRGLVHHARYLEPGEDPDPEQTLAVAHQELPAKILGLLPKSEVWRALRLFNHDLGMRAINLAKYHAGRLEGLGSPYRQSHAGFAFLLDYVPNWKWAYGRRERRGLIQYQIFLPEETAHETLAAVLRANQAAGFVPYLGVFKRHRPDPFWLTHSVDGWSLALDFKVSPARRAALWAHCATLTERVLDAGGKFYFAKDLVIGPDAVQRMFPADKLAAFLELKRELDPEGLLQTNLSRRLFGDMTLREA